MIKRTEPNVRHTQQPKSNWCWAASLLMVMEVMRGKVNPDITVEKIVKRVFGDQEVAENRGAYIHLIKSAFHTYGINAEYHEKVISWDALINEIDNNRPIIIDYGWRDGGYHVMVVGGYEIRGNDIRFICLNDPWRNKEAPILYDSLVSGNYDSDGFKGEGNKWIGTFTFTKR